MTTTKSCDVSAGGCGRTEELITVTVIKARRAVTVQRTRPIVLNADGLCAACVQALAGA